jgi:hypothetical protein
MNKVAAGVWTSQSGPCRAEPAIGARHPQRHAYGATDNIVLDMRMGEAIMGDVTRTGSVPELRVMVRGTAPIHKIEMIKNGTHIYAAEPAKRETSFLFQDSAATPGESYYYIRVQQEDGQMAWGTPIRVDYQPR